MKTFNKRKFISLLLTLSLSLVGTMSTPIIAIAAGQSTVNLGTTSHFVGHIFAMQSITAATGATVQGQLLARNGAVSLDTNTITNGYCATTTATPTTPTVTGGELPKTSTPLYGLFLMGIILTMVGALVWRKRKSYE